MSSMQSTRHRRPIAAAAVLAAAVATLAGCSGKSGTGSDTGATSVSPAPSAEQPVEPSGTGEIAMSPGGVTTKIDVPAQSTEEQYAQACLATKDWMAAKGGDPHGLVEPYLKELQTTAGPGPSTFRKTWAELSDPQRAAVIIAVRAAADGGC